MAHGITALRVLLTVPLILAIRGTAAAPPAWVVALLFAIIAASDVLDGRVARAAGSTSSWGRGFDHGADIFFVLSAFVTYASIGTAAWWVPASVAGAFALYVVDARRAAPPTTARRWAGRIGHIGGVCNYVVIGVLIGNETLRLHLLPPGLMQIILAAVPLYSLASVVVRWLPGSAAPRSTFSVG
jgi:phosphatidylglycerophosphate synthase